MKLKKEKKTEKIRKTKILFFKNKTKKYLDRVGETSRQGLLKQS